MPYLFSHKEVTGSIPTTGAFPRSPPKTPSTSSRPSKQPRQRLNKSQAFDENEPK
ncbi:hypothetical protein DPMN_021194 [Dreissena polymorpha]|uniref:Uncharacterized protein n=1 Tax=Dreissena polymorpha TaxID=45954 RepID=A0A9D4NMC4_DREPO|nr:hypothetical protein DPMN_021194 [Dreissena polymorpha]